MVKVGIVGTGHLGKIHLKLLKELEVYEVIGFYDANPEIATFVEREFQVKRYTTFSQLLKEVDAVVITTPTTFHYKFASQAIKNNKHVFIEKPVTHTLREARELLKLERETHTVKIQVGHVERFNPAFLALKGKNIQPMFIEAHRLAMFNPRGTDVSVVLDLMIHDLDIILKIVQSPVKKIHASGVNIISKSADIANARIEFGNGCVANVTASRLSVKNMRKIRFFQSDAYISLDFLDKKTEIVKLSEKATNDMSLELKIDDNTTRYLDFEIPELHPVNAIKEELTCFADSIMYNKDTEVTLLDGVSALELAHHILDKMQ